MKKETLSRLYRLSPLILCILVMLPRLASAQFGFFDDAQTLMTSQKILAGQWDINAEVGGGRFRPGYWLFYAGVYSIAGQDPLLFYLTNLALYLFLTYGVIHLATTIRLSNFGVWLAGVSFAISGPILENVYTLSKPELMQLVWMAMAFFALSHHHGSRSRRSRALTWILAAASVFLACTTKETGILLAPIAVLFFLIDRFSPASRSGHSSSLPVARHAMLTAALAGVLVYLCLYWAFRRTGLATEGYASQFTFSLSWLYTKLRQWIDWLLRDFFYLLPMGLVSVFVLLKKGDRKSIPVVLGCMLWSSIWLAVYIPWVFTQEYYLLPIACAAAILTGIFFDLVFSLTSGIRWQAILAWAAIGLSCLLLVLTLPNQYSNGRLQLAVDRANADMLQKIVLDAPSGSRILINIHDYNEYVDEFIHWVIGLEGRDDLRVDRYLPGETAAPIPGENVWIVSPVLDNQFYPSVRMGVQEASVSRWTESLLPYLAGREWSIENIYSHFRISNIDPLRFFCPLTTGFAYCNVPNAPLDQRLLVYGWDLVRLVP